ncbi:SUN domain-containing protein 1 isoform X2 [Sturnira hondurensis]|uniref:SUN domain-containing protein 1 isoform X2 n=1 Tax=Sturnira hondurensis TaxID=192404 RepID=UPI001879A145|nr:SUN domain-containing protein 1 isoform X2 [Sturnira hondurensis]
MDFSRLHTYTPPQCVPENTGYTYALSSSYSSDALDFETEHRLDPVFDSPRMSRRSLRLAATARGTEGGLAGHTDACPSSTTSLRDRAARTAKQHRGASKLVFSGSHAPRQATAGPSSGLQGSASLRPPVLDESLIREQTQVDHFWGLDDDGDLKGGTKVFTQGNGDSGASVARSNGYTCRACSQLSARQDAPVHAPPHSLASWVYSRDHAQKRGASYVDRILWLATYTSSSVSSVLVQLFRVVLMKLNYESENYKLKSYESKDGESETYKSKSHESQARSEHSGKMTVTESPREDSRLQVNGDSLCHGREGTERLETHLATRSQSPGTGGAAGTAPLGSSHTGHVARRTLQRTGAAGRAAAQAVLSGLWSAAVAPGKAATGMLWWLGRGWYQLVTLMSWLNVFLLTRCLRNTCKFLILLLPLLLLLGAGLSSWGQSGFLSLLPAFNWTRTLRAPRGDELQGVFSTGAAPPLPSPEGVAEASPWHWMREVERQVASLSGQCQSRDGKLSELTASLQQLQVRVDQLDDGGAGVSSLVRSMVRQHLKDLGAGRLLGSQTDPAAFYHEHESRISNLEDILGKLTERSEAVQKELGQTKLRTASTAEQQQHLQSAVAQLELELGRLQAELAAWQPLKASCEEAHGMQEKVDAQVRETVRLLFSDDQQGGALDQLLQKLSSRFVGWDDLQAVLRELELRILRNVTHHVSVTGRAPASDAVLSVMHEQGAVGITEAQARVIVSNALRLYSQDKTGLVDFALESGGGSILSTRCSETYETKTALISLFGIPLWYFSQSPRVVIQPDMYPGNCWAFRGSQGYLVVRLSMEIRPTSFALEHIPKTLSPTGNISSAPRDFSVHGLENEYQEEGQLLGQFVFDQDGESLQTFPVPRPERAFQVVELRVSSNWGHPEYTCLYRFRVHGEPV